MRREWQRQGEQQQGPRDITTTSNNNTETTTKTGENSNSRSRRRGKTQRKRDPPVKQAKHHEHYTRGREGTMTDSLARMFLTLDTFQEDRSWLKSEAS